MTLAISEPRIGNGQDVPAPQQKPDRIVQVDTSAFSNLLDTGRFEHMKRVATLFAESQMVPAHFQKQPANCFIALQMAIRLEVDPFMFMQNTFIVHGRPGMEAKLGIALVNARGPFTGPIQYSLSGAGKTRQCTAFATHKITGERCESTVTYQMAEDEGWTKNTKWRTLTDLMLCYRSAMFLSRLYAPECLMGMQTTDELEDLGESRERDRKATAGLNARLSAPPHAVVADALGPSTETTQSSPAEAAAPGGAPGGSGERTNQGPAAAAPVAPRRRGRAEQHAPPEDAEQQEPPAPDAAESQTTEGVADEAINEAIEQGPDAFKKALHELAKRVSPAVNRSKFEGGVFKWVLAINPPKGTTPQVTHDQWRSLYRAIEGGRFDFATGQILD